MQEWHCNCRKDHVKLNLPYVNLTLLQSFVCYQTETHSLDMQTSLKKLLLLTYVIFSHVVPWAKSSQKENTDLDHCADPPRSLNCLTVTLLSLLCVFTRVSLPWSVIGGLHLSLDKSRLWHLALIKKKLAISCKTSWDLQDLAWSHIYRFCRYCTSSLPRHSTSSYTVHG